MKARNPRQEFLDAQKEKPERMIRPFDQGPWIYCAQKMAYRSESTGMFVDSIDMVKRAG